MVVTFRDPEPGGKEDAGAGDAAMQALDLDGAPYRESHKEKKARLDRSYTTDVDLEEHRHGNW
jgi:hypothetical protein